MLTVLGVLSHSQRLISLNSKMATAPILMKVLSASVAVAPAAGRKIADILNTGKLSIKEKAPKDLQTEADRAAQKLIVGSLSSKFPTLKIIGEEDQSDVDNTLDTGTTQTIDYDEAVLNVECPSRLSDVKMEDIIVWVDPLDGTSEFVQGFLDHVTVLIGISVNGESVAGVVHQPFHNYESPDATIGRTIWGVVGGGLHGINVHPPPEGENIIVCTRSHSDQTTQAAVDACKPTRVDKVGGCGHKVLRVLEGQAHAYVFASGGCSKWDTAAPEALLKAVGGQLTDITGVPIPYLEAAPRKNVSGVLATNGVNPEEYKSRIPCWIIDKFAKVRDETDPRK